MRRSGQGNDHYIGPCCAAAPPVFAQHVDPKTAQARHDRACADCLTDDQTYWRVLALVSSTAATWVTT